MPNRGISRVAIMLLERSGDAIFREEAERVIELLLNNVQKTTLYARESRLYLPEEKIMMLAKDFEDEDMYAQVDKKRGYYIIEINLPVLSEKIVGERIEMSDLSRMRIRAVLRALLKNNSFRAFLVHELIHVLMRKKDVNYSMNSDEYSVYVNNPEELSAWFNQAVYDLVYRARGSKLDPRRVIGYDESEFMDNVATFLNGHGLWGKYTDESKKRILRRSYTGYEDAIRQATA
jgi:hypothetical protein